MRCAGSLSGFQEHQKFPSTVRWQMALKALCSLRCTEPCEGLAAVSKDVYIT